MHWDGPKDRLNEYQLDLIRGNAERQTDPALRRTYELCREGLRLDEAGNPPSAAAVQYFVAAWRELRRRQKKSAGSA
jgi:hypothetical protein